MRSRGRLSLVLAPAIAAAGDPQGAAANAAIRMSSPFWTNVSQAADLLRHPPTPLSRY